MSRKREFPKVTNEHKFEEDVWSLQSRGTVTIYRIYSASTFFDFVSYIPSSFFYFYFFKNFFRGLSNCEFYFYIHRCSMAVTLGF